jgi:hypothetical protein
VSYDINRELSETVEYKQEQTYPISVQVYPPFDATFVWKSTGSSDELALNHPIVLITRLTLANMITTPIRLMSVVLDLPSEVEELSASQAEDAVVKED